MCSGHQCKWIGVGLQLVNTIGVVQQFGNREVQLVFAAQNFKDKVIWLPSLVIVGQYGKAGNRASVAVIQSVVVGEHTLSKSGIVGALNLNVDVNQTFSAVF